MEERYVRLRSQLEQLGYNFSLRPDSIPLVEKLVADLVQTTDSLRKYMKIAKEVVCERDNLLLGAEPYKCDNAKLVKECNDLHSTFLQFREQNEKLQKDLRKRIYILEKEKIDGDTEREKLQNRIRVLELESAKKTDKILSLQGAKLGIKPKLKSSSTSALFKNRLNAKENSECETMALAEQRIKTLLNEIGRLKEENLELTETNNAYKTQINNRNKELQRLTTLLEGGRPIEALNRDCCYKDIDLKITRMQDEINLLKKKNSELENRLKDSVSKQHEAMKRALNLAERNKILEKEMRDIDQMALAVEAECNSTVKCNAEKLSRLQERIHETVLQVQELEREVADLKREKRELLSDFEVVKTEKRHLQTVLETALDEKKRLTDRINQFTIIENDLNLEIDRLVRLSSSQKQRIAELECKLLTGQLDLSTEQLPTRKVKIKRIKKQPKPTSPSKSNKQESVFVSPLRLHSRPKMRRDKKLTTRISAGGDDRIFVPDNTPESQSSLRASDSESETEAPDKKKGKCPDPDGCIKEIKKLIEKELRNKDVCLTHLRELIGKEIDNMQAQANKSLEHFKAERDYYMKECRVLMEKMKSMYNVPDDAVDLTRKLNEKEQLIMGLQHENRCLSQEKHNLMTRLETSRDRIDNDLESASLRSSSKRLERERDLYKADMQRLEEERDALRQRIKEMAENHAREKSRLQKLVVEAEDEVRKLENERRDIMTTQGSRRATINNLQDECDLLRDQLRKCQGELNQQRAAYSQLKILHEQTDLALADSQGQLIQLEKEMHLSQERMRSFEKQGGDADKEILNLRNDITIMKGNLARIDHEKDALLSELDEKTERIALLEHELKSKENTIIAMETAIGDMKKKISITMDNSCSREKLLKNATAEVQKLQQDLDAAIRAKDLAYQENRRIQDDLASCTADCRNAHNDLDIARRQIDDLKRQLQQYVAEVKRTEDLISQKEIERNEMLDHFRSLSQEATVLESNNHSLETEASQTKVQLSLALDHANDLERKMEAQETMIRSYEKQIMDMTGQIAKMEVQNTQHAKIQEQSEAELANMRELCVKLDKQKDDLMRQLGEVDGARAQVGREADRLRRESESLHNTLAKDRNSQENVEKLLAQCRQECVDQKLLNQELQAELQRCKSRVEELQIKLSSAPQIGRDDAFQSSQGESYRRTSSQDDVLAPDNFVGAPKSNGQKSFDSRSANKADPNRTSTRKLSFALPHNNSNASRKGGYAMSSIPESESESMSDVQRLQSIRDASGLSRTRPNTLSSSIQAIRNKEGFMLKPIPESEYDTIANGQRSQRDSSVIRTRLSNSQSIRNTDGLANAQYSRAIRDASGNIIGTVHRSASSISSLNGSQTIRDSSSVRARLDSDDLRPQITRDSSNTRARSYPSSNIQSIGNARVDSVASTRLRSFPERSAHINSYHTDPLAEKSAHSYHETSAEKILTDAELAKNTPYASISAYLENSAPDIRGNDVLSMLPYVSPSHRLSISSESGRTTRDQEQENPMDDDAFRDKNLHGESCACLRVCKCHEEEEKEGGRHYRPHSSSFVAPVSHTHVFTSTGIPASRYTASYSFAYENPNTTPVLRTKTSSEEYNKYS